MKKMIFRSDLSQSVNVHILMFTLNLLIFKSLSRSVNVNVSFFKTFPTRALPPLFLYKNVKFFIYINVHMFTRHYKPANLLTYKV